MAEAKNYSKKIEQTQPESLNQLDRKDAEKDLSENLTKTPEYPDSNGKIPSFEDVFPKGIDSPELTENNESIINDPIRGPKNSATDLGKNYIQILKELGGISSGLIKKLEKQIQKVFEIKSFIHKDKGLNDPLLKELFPDKNQRTKWINENPQYKNHSRLAYLNTIKKIIEIGILDTFKEIDNFFKENKVDFPKMENVYTKDVMDFYDARIKDLSNFLQSPFEKTSEEIKEDSSNERKSLQSEISENIKATAVDNVLYVESDQEGGINRQKGVYDLEMYFEDFSPEKDLATYIKRLESKETNSLEMEKMINPILRFLVENKGNSKVYEKLFFRMINLSKRIKNNEIPENEAKKLLSFYLDVIAKAEKSERAPQKTQKDSLMGTKYSPTEEQTPLL